MYRSMTLTLLTLSIIGCGMGDACEELEEARCECDENLCGESKADEENDERRRQACKEELEEFVCAEY